MGSARKSRQCILWLHPNLCKPPHPCTRPEKVEELYEAFRVGGWNAEEPALIGYIDGGSIQLLSGSHRWESARRADIKIPVVIHDVKEVVNAFGRLRLWATLMTAPKAGTP